MTVDTDNLKALALAADEGGDIFVMMGKLQAFQFEACPATVLALIAEVERLRDERDAEITERLKDLHKLICVQTERDELRAEVERLRADSGRYRWLRDRPENPDEAVIDVAIWQNCAGTSLRGDELDSQIDAAIEKEKA